MKPDSQTIKNALIFSAKRQLFELSYFEFFREFWSEICQDAFTYNWHVEFLCDELQKVGERIINRLPKLYDLVINIPPAESKSSICTILFPVWLWIKDASIRIISGSYASSLSTEHALKSRDVIKSDKFQMYFGDRFALKSDQDNKQYYVNDCTGSRKAVSTGSAVTGSHGHLVIIDDPVNPIQASSSVEMSNANRWLFETMATRVVDREVTPFILVMQRLSENDPTAEFIARRKRVRHICIPAEITDDVSPVELREMYTDGIMNVPRTPRKALIDLRSQLGSRGYASQFLQRPAPAEGNILKLAWFSIYEKHKVDLNAPSFYIDTAYTAKENNDPTAIICFKMIGNDLFIKHCTTVRMEFPELIKHIQTYCAGQGYARQSRIYIEPKASGKSVIQQLRRQTGLNIIEDEPPRESKIVRVTSASPVIEAGRIHLPDSGDWVDDFVNECCMFPNAKHDDRVDCLIGAINVTLIKKKGIRKFVTSK